MFLRSVFLRSVFLRSVLLRSVFLRSGSVLVVSLLAFLFGVAGPAEAAPSSALLPVMAPDLLQPQKRAIEERIRVVAAQSGMELQAAADTARGLADAKQVGAACNIESLACQAQMGVLLGVKQVLVARVSSDWSGDRIELRLLDALRGSTLRETTQPLPKDAALRTRVLDGAVLRVIAPAKTGTLVVDAAPASPLFVDGVAISVREQKTTVEGLAPGPHDVELRPEGAAVDAKRAVVVAGQSVEVAFGLPSSAEGPSPEGPPPSAEAQAALWPWLVGGGAIIAAASGAAAGGLQAALEYTPMDREQRDALQVTGISLLGTTAVGVVLAGAGGVLLAMEDQP